MTGTELKEFWHAAPFVPFNIVLPSGEKVPVPHPDFLSVSSSGRIARVWKKGDVTISMDVFFITAVETADKHRVQTGDKRRVAAYLANELRQRTSNNVGRVLALDTRMPGTSRVARGRELDPSRRHVKRSTLNHAVPRWAGSESRSDFIGFSRQDIGPPV